MEGVFAIEGTSFDRSRASLLMSESFISACQKSDVPMMSLTQRLTLHGLSSKALYESTHWLVSSGELVLVDASEIEGGLVCMYRGTRAGFFLEVIDFYELIHMNPSTSVWGVLTDWDKEYIASGL